MREAVNEDGALLAPSVGTWRSRVGLGAPLTPGERLGVLWRDGRPLDVVLPAGACGVAVEVRPDGTWVAAGEWLVRAGDGGAVSLAAPTVRAMGGPAGAVAVCAETDGTVYLSPEPGSASFAPEGAVVAAQATLALIEVMKTFTPVRAAFAGTVARVEVASGQAVREGQVLLWTTPVSTA